MPQSVIGPNKLPDTPEVRLAILQLESALQCVKDETKQQVIYGQDGLVQAVMRAKDLEARQKDLELFGHLEKLISRLTSQNLQQLLVTADWFLALKGRLGLGKSTVPVEALRLVGCADQRLEAAPVSQASLSDEAVSQKTT